ncbi:hypothetical protein DFH29DRAFT_471778 [Suillus ampliporus]|nr:hypothetical protein DFH29DRAFT_471778 [Suillus ampliporus]
MSTDTNNSSAAPGVARTVQVELVTHPNRDDHFRAVAAPSEYLKANQKKLRVTCTQCLKTLEKPQKCAKCKSVWYCSRECQKKHWPTHKPTCHEVERSSGILKFIRMIQANPLIMRYLAVGIIFDCGLLKNPRIGFDVPFMARVDIAIEPSDFLDFVGLYVNDLKSVGKKLQGMVQVNAITPWIPSTMDPLTPKRMNEWREARARYNAEGLANDPVGLVEFINSCADSDEPGTGANSLTSELHIPAITLNIARKREPFAFTSAITGIRSKKPMSTVACLEYINLHIRADKQNQLHLRTEMTEQDKEVIRAAGRNEDILPVQVLKSKMGSEHLYANVMQLTR